MHEKITSMKKIIYFLILALIGCAHTATTTAQSQPKTDRNVASDSDDHSNYDKPSRSYIYKSVCSYLNDLGQDASDQNSYSSLKTVVSTQLYSPDHKLIKNFKLCTQTPQKYLQFYLLPTQQGCQPDEDAYRFRRYPNDFEFTEYSDDINYFCLRREVFKLTVEATDDGRKMPTFIRPLDNPIFTRIYQVNETLRTAKKLRETRDIEWYTTEGSTEKHHITDLEYYFLTVEGQCAKDAVAVQHRVYTNPKAQTFRSLGLVEYQSKENKNDFPVQIVPEEFKDFSDQPGFGCIPNKIFKNVMFQTEFTVKAREYYPIDYAAPPQTPNTPLHGVSVFMSTEEKTAPDVYLTPYTEAECQNKTCYVATYDGPLYNTCDGMCRMQGYSVVIDSSGFVVKFLASTLVYQNLSEYIMDKGSLERLRLIVNNPILLKKIYEQIPEDNFAARMSLLSTDFFGGGNTVGTFLVHMARVRSALKMNNWNPYVGSSPGYRH